MNRKAQKTT